MQYKVINTQTGHETFIDVPNQFKNAEVDNLVLKWHHSDDDPIDLFDEPEDNRKENTTLMKKLRISIPKYGQLQPATVNKEGSLWEGNHRKKVTKETDTPFLFIVDKGEHNLDQDQFTDEINEVREDYKIEDWKDRYITRYERGEDKYEPYQRFDDFMGKANNKSIYNNLIYFSPDDTGRGELKEKFIAGTFNPTEDEWARAEGYRERISEVGEKWGNDKAVKLSYFMVAYIKLLQNPEFKHTRFLRKLRNNSHLMRECARSDDYLTQINILFNKGEKNKYWLS